MGVAGNGHATFRASMQPQHATRYCASLPASVNEPLPLQDGSTGRFPDVCFVGMQIAVLSAEFMTVVFS